VSRHRREVERRDQQLIAAAPADEADHALFGVAGIDPRKACRVEVELV
jgi:hypothetical protein